jgi:hypothetical protein
MRKAAEVLNPYFQIRSLRDFNAKFGRQWVPGAILVEEIGAIGRSNCSTPAWRVG